MADVPILEEVTWTGDGMGTTREAFFREIAVRLPTNLPRVEVADAVICTLAERLSGGVVDRILSELPESLRPLLRPYAKPIEAQAKGFDKDEFYMAVAEHLNVDPTDVRRIISAVFSALHSQITEATSERVASQLPDELSSTWIAARHGVSAPH
ncbi:MAG TPA: DUF2267 domain-containing protein [Myxococcaceae bacterium]|nr:DUF2267 domain-containing protein [Myxococcaceae bacterium]